MSQPQIAAPFDPDRLVQDLVDHRLGFHQLPEGLDPEIAAEIRRLALEQLADCRIEHIAHHSLDVARASTRNCENLIGVAQVPMGVVGPLVVHGDHFQGRAYVPLATTEAALVASTNRGCAAIAAAGGARVLAEDVGMTRAPVFRTSGIEESRRLVDWIENNFERISALAGETSRYLTLTEIRPYVFSTTVFLRFRFSAGDAMGMNMATIACDRVVTDLIEPEARIKCVALSGNYCVDKKVADVNFKEGRGQRLFAEIELDADTLRTVLKTEADALLDVQYRKNLLGSIAAGARGFNAHFANALAAFFVATGQDLAHVVDGSMGVTFVEKREPGSVYFSVFLPSVPLGAVGGGIGLATQAESLAILGVSLDPDAPGKAAKCLGEILAGTVLASELSLMAAFTSGDVARAHVRLGRGGPDAESS